MALGNAGVQRHESSNNDDDGTLAAWNQALGGTEKGNFDGRS